MPWNPSPEVAVAREAAEKLGANTTVVIFTRSDPNITESQVCGRMTIPRACIQKCITLEDGESGREGEP